jgi:hypothetical protein
MKNKCLTWKSTLNLSETILEGEATVKNISLLDMFWLL